MLEMLQNWGIGLSTVLSPMNLALLLAGTMLGLIVGALPGLNSSIAMSILIPVTYSMNPGAALAMLAGVYTGSTAGGSVSAILLEVPGTGAAVVTAFDGHAMFKQGKGGLALGISAVSSVFGGIVAAIVLGAFAPFIAAQALKFGPPEYLMLSVMGFASVIGMSMGRMSKNVMAMLIGLAISMIGISPQGGIKRFTFDSSALLEGIPLVPLLIGLFGISAIIGAVADQPLKRGKQFVSDMKQAVNVVRMQYPDRKMLKSFLPIWLQSTLIGNIVGAIPGAGMTVAIFMAYDQVKRFRPDLPFGEGMPEGVAAAECANNSVVGSSMIPLLALGVPGNPASALFLGALLIHGLRTGPKFFSETPDVAYTLIAAFLLASIALLPLMHVFVNYMASYVLKLRREVLNGLVLILCVTGAFACGNNPTYIIIAIVFGFIGFLLKKFSIPFGPLILATVLGSMLESYYIQTLVVLRRDLSRMLNRPICVGLLIISIIFLLLPMYRVISAKVKAARSAKKAI